jgi:sugar phosphate isomerase/epimerase
MIRLSAFADEIAADLSEQISVLRQEGIGHIDLRAAWGVNVLDLTDAQVTEARRLLAEAGIGVAAIGSPIGKVPVDGDFGRHVDRFERALTLARTFETTYVRMFSFYPPADSPDAEPATWRDEVLRRLRELTARAGAAGITLVHENEKDIYGDTINRCVDLLTTINDPRFVAAFDPANFIQCGQEPYPAAYAALRPWVAYVHVKDAQADGTVTAAGEGIAGWPEILSSLRESGYNGFLSLEPHLAASGRLGGFSGPDRFRYASQALQRLLRGMEWEYS